MQPVIGITTGHGLNEYGQGTVVLTDAYVDAIVQAGAVPLIIPSVRLDGDLAAVYSRLDGILFSGGGDIAPERFGGAPHPRLEGVDRARDDLELDLLLKAVADGKPFLGICRGCQLVNVGLGGTLYTHIPDQLQGALDHANPADQRHALVHEVRFKAASGFWQVIGDPSMRVNSHHHQGIKDVAPGLDAVGHSPDGLVEAIAVTDHPFGWAVQWHPEWLTDLEPTRRLFSRFVEAAQGRRA